MGGRKIIHETADFIRSLSPEDALKFVGVYDSALAQEGEDLLRNALEEVGATLHESAASLRPGSCLTCYEKWKVEQLKTGKHDQEYHPLVHCVACNTILLNRSESGPRHRREGCKIWKVLEELNVHIEWLQQHGLIALRHRQFFSERDVTSARISVAPGVRADKLSEDQAAEVGERLLDLIRQDPYLLWTTQKKKEFLGRASVRRQQLKMDARNASDNEDDATTSVAEIADDHLAGTSGSISSSNPAAAGWVPDADDVMDGLSSDLSVAAPVPTAYAIDEAGHQMRRCDDGLNDDDFDMSIYLADLPGDESVAGSSGAGAAFADGVDGVPLWLGEPAGVHGGLNYFLQQPAAGHSDGWTEQYGSAAYSPEPEARDVWLPAMNGGFDAADGFEAYGVLGDSTLR